MSLIMGLIGLERLELFTLELEKMLHLTVYTLTSTTIYQWAPNLVKLYITIRFRLSSIMTVIRLERLQLFALELEKCYI